MLSNELVARHASAASRTAIAATTLPSPELPRGLEVETRRGVCWRIDAPVEELWPEQERWLSALSKRPSTALDVVEPPHDEIVALRNALPSGVVLIDIETAVCSDAPLFLAGALHTHKGLPMVTQLVARGEHEEAALLTALDEIFQGKQCLLSFNGKAIDVPTLLERRAELHLGREPWPRKMVHCDLLPHARRRWKTRLPNCKLQTLETYICGRQRGADNSVVGAAEAYRDFLETGAPRPLQVALHHHAMDIITLWQLALWMAYS